MGKGRRGGRQGHGNPYVEQSAQPFWQKRPQQHFQRPQAQQQAGRPWHKQHQQSLKQHQQPVKQHHLKQQRPLVKQFQQIKQEHHQPMKQIKQEHHQPMKRHQQPSKQHGNLAQQQQKKKQHGNQQPTKQHQQPGQWVFKPSSLAKQQGQPARQPFRSFAHRQRAAQQSTKRPVQQHTARQPAGPPPRQQPPAKVVSTAKTRQRIGTERLTGKVTSWKGKFGWIVPDVPIMYQQAGNKGISSKIYLAQEDVEQEIELGGNVSFYLYSDATGLGAMHVIAAKGAKTNSQKQGQQAPAQSKSAQQNGRALGKDGGKSKGAGKKRKAETNSFLKEPKAKLGKMALKEPKAKLGKMALKVKQARAEEKKPSGPNLPRKMVSQDRVLGTVLQWNRKFGWIRPSEPIKLPDAKKHSGKIYVHQQDLSGAESLERGASVQFTVFQDSSGLGAQEVVTVQN